MLIILIKTVILLFVVYFILRIMGKRQLGEMQPFELVITLVIAEVACLPMNDPSIPLYFGIFPIAIIGFVHVLLTFIAQKNLKFRRAIDGKSIMVVAKGGIIYENLRELNMNVNDLLDAARSAGHPDMLQIEYAIIETNGKLSVIEKSVDENQPTLLPKQLVIDGEILTSNLKELQLSTNFIFDKLTKHKIDSIKKVVYMDIRQNGKIYISLKDSSFVICEIEYRGEW